jgi:hypothetical protein
MFCPRCGAENSEETNFCRGCGEDLSSISRALAKKPPDGIVGTIGQALTQNSLFQLEWLKDHKRRALGELLIGVFSLLAIIWFHFFGHLDPDFIHGVFAAMAGYLIALGVWDLWRMPKTPKSVGGRTSAEIPATPGTQKELEPLDTTEIIPVPSVIEPTTRKLKYKNR